MYSNGFLNKIILNVWMRFKFEDRTDFELDKSEMYSLITFMFDMSNQKLVQ